jgi:hypothetical protein
MGAACKGKFTLETLIDTIRLCDEEHANALHHRYSDWWKIDREIEKHARHSA